MAKINIEVESSLTSVVADELQKCVDERRQWLKDNPKFRDEYPNLADNIRKEIIEFKNIIEQLKA